MGPNPLDPGVLFLIFNVTVVHVGIPPEPRLDARVLGCGLPL